MRVTTNCETTKSYTAVQYSTKSDG